MTEDKKTLQALKKLAVTWLMSIVGGHRWDVANMSGDINAVHAFANNVGQETFVKPVLLFVKNDIRQTVVFVHRNKRRGFDYLLDTKAGRIYINHLTKGKETPYYLGFIDLATFIKKLKQVANGVGVFSMVDKYFYTNHFQEKYPDNVIEWVSLEKFKSPKYKSFSPEIEKYNLEMTNRMFNIMLTEEYSKGLRDFEIDQLAHRLKMENPDRGKLFEVDLLPFIRSN